MSPPSAQLIDLQLIADFQDQDDVGRSQRLLRKEVGLHVGNRLAAALPVTDAREVVRAFALGDPDFYVRHRQQTRFKPRLADVLLPKIPSGAALTDREISAGVTVRRFFDALHALNYC